MQMIQLGKYISEYSERNKSGEDLPVYSVTNSEGFCKDYFSKDVASQDRTTYKVVPRGCFAYNPSRINVGSVDWQHCEDRVIVSPLYVVFKVSDSLDQQYLYYYLKSDKCLYFIKQLASGSVRDNLRFSALRKFLIPDISLEEQKQVVKILDRVSDLISEQKFQLTKLDELVKSRFIELFGDRNDPQIELIDLIIDGAGLSYGIVQPGEDGTGDMGVLRPVDMVDGKIATTSIKYIDRSIGDGFKKTELTGDELLITVRGTTGITALTDERFKKMNVTRGIAVVRYDRNKINPVYLNAFLNADESQRYIQEHTRGATLQQINLSDLRVQKIIVPPMELQERFAAFAEQSDKSKLAVKQSLEKLETLKKSLMQQYFG